MKATHAAIVSLLEMVDDLNQRASEAPSNTPCDFAISFQSPFRTSQGEAADSMVRIEITYESEGSEESSYVIQDAVELKLSESSLSQVYYVEEGLRSSQVDVPQREIADGTLLANITLFCEARLSANDPPLGPL